MYVDDGFINSVHALCVDVHCVLFHIIHWCVYIPVVTMHVMKACMAYVGTNNLSMSWMDLESSTLNTCTALSISCWHADHVYWHTDTIF